MKNWTPLMGIYLILAIAGFFIPWYYNLQFILYGDAPLTISRFLGDGMSTFLTSSLTTDLLIGASAFFIWMIVEGRRLGMKHLWVYAVCTFMIAFAFSCPLFLLMRERKLQAK